MHTRRGVLLGILAVIIFTLLILQTPLLTRARGVMWDWWVAAAARGAGIGRLDVSNDVMTQLARLQAENTRMAAELGRSARLRRQLGEVVFNDFRQIPALVSVRAVDGFRSQYFLNRGTGHGIVSGAPVVTDGSVLIGFITELSERTSVVRLLFHPATDVSAEVLTGEEEGITRGLVQGKSYTSLLLTTVPRDRKLSVGNTVVTAAGGNQLPYGLTIGTVGAIQSGEGDAYQSALIDLPYDSDNLEAVMILVPAET